MRSWFIIGVFIILIAFPSHAIGDSWVRIVEPEPGIYVHGKKIMPYHFHIFIGSDFVNVRVKTSPDIFVVYMAVYDVMRKEMFYGIWDYDDSDGYSYNFTGIPSGIYAIISVGAALDVDEPVAFDIISPVIFIHA